MRIVWKDSLVPKEYKPIKYRKFMVYGTPKGWTTDVPEDNNIYSNHYCAQNSIDAYYVVYVETILELYCMDIISKEEMYAKLNQ